MHSYLYMSFLDDVMSLLLLPRLRFMLSRKVALPLVTNVSWGSDLPFLITPQAIIYRYEHVWAVSAQKENTSSFLIFIIGWYF